jgi:hypothetical protein
MTTEKDWEQVQIWLNEITGWAVCEIATHPEKLDRIESWLAAMKPRYLSGERTDELFELIRSEWEKFRCEDRPTGPA